MRLTLSLLTSLALLAVAGGCSRQPEENAALASLDARLTNGGLSATNGTADTAVATPPARASAPRNALAPHAGESRPAASVAGPTLGEAAVRQRADRGDNRLVERVAAAADRTVDACGRQISTGAHWADQLPAPFALYPGARVAEAAGVTNGRCALRLVSFTTADAPTAVIAHYRRLAERAGYDAEVQHCRGEQRLGGTRGEEAYMLFLRRTATGGSAVDLVVKGG